MGVLISSNFKGGECFFQSDLGWSVILPNLKGRKCSLYIFFIKNKREGKKRTMGEQLVFPKTETGKHYTFLLPTNFGHITEKYNSNVKINFS